MKVNVIIRENQEDKFSLPNNEKNVLEVPSYLWKSDSRVVGNDLKSILSRAKLSPNESVIDFANLCLATYTVDQIVSRSKYGYQDWSRHLALHIPVLNPEKWNSLKSEIEDFLSFLSGDKWEVSFRKREKVYSKKRVVNSKITGVSLFSGGMDSFIGSVDLANTKNSIALVGHHKLGGEEKSTQQKLVNALKKEFPKKEVHSFLFYVGASKKHTSFGSENTQRARSVIFIALGLLVANSIGETIPLTIPENGLISLNVPLTKTRYGSYSTRTTHPNFIFKLGQILAKLEIKNPLINPYRFDTKGEMLANCKNLDFVKKNVHLTISCSKPGHYKRLKHRNEIHCGHCIPCMIRRASMHKVGIDTFKGYYVHDIKAGSGSKSDLRAFKIGWSRLQTFKKNKVFLLLKSGPIPCEEDDLKKYIGVYEKGMKEVNDFLTS